MIYVVLWSSDCQNRYRWSSSLMFHYHSAATSSGCCCMCWCSMFLLQPTVDEVGGGGGGWRATPEQSRPQKMNKTSKGLYLYFILRTAERSWGWLDGWIHGWMDAWLSLSVTGSCSYFGGVGVFHAVWMIVHVCSSVLCSVWFLWRRNWCQSHSCRLRSFRFCL